MLWTLGGVPRDLALARNAINQLPWRQRKDCTRAAALRSARHQEIEDERQRVDDDIEQVRKTEMRRGKRPIDIEAANERRRMLAALREILNYGTLDELKAAMTAFGLSEKNLEWAEALRIWNAERARK